MTILDSIGFLLNRRSVSVKDLRLPAPNDDELDLILGAATRVPDHGKLCPWRIVVLEGQGKFVLGAMARQIFAQAHADATEAQLAHELARFNRAPLVLAVISTPILGTKPVWEQQLSAGAVCMNILHAVHILGYGGKWLTEWVAYDAAITQSLLELFPAAGNIDIAQAKIAGFIYIGSKIAEPDDRERPNLSDVVTTYNGQ